MKALVTGGGGFLGKTIVKMLVERGDEVTTFQRGQYPELDKLGVKSVRGDLATDTTALTDAVEGCDIVFHVAAKAGVWGTYQQYQNANITGTLNVINACKEKHVKHLVYTSSPSVVFSGKNEDGIDESTKYPVKYLTHYPKTKAIAEQTVLQANNSELATVALRPHLIWGPNDPHLVKRIIERSKAGRLRLVGSGDNLVDSTYVANAASAHIAAGDSLIANSSNAPCAGKAYFISNGEPMAMGDLINWILAAAHQPPVTKSISPTAAYTVGLAMELFYKLFRIKSEPIMTRFVARQLACSQWYDISAAKRDFGYNPAISINQGLKQLEKALSDDK